MARASARRWRWPPDSRKPALADHGVVAVGLRHDELVRCGRLGGGDDAVLAGAEPAERDVGADRIVEQRHFLADDGNRTAQARQRHVAQVLAVDDDGAASARRTAAPPG